MMSCWPSTPDAALNEVLADVFDAMRCNASQAYVTMRQPLHTSPGHGTLFMSKLTMFPMHCSTLRTVACAWSSAACVVFALVAHWLACAGSVTTTMMMTVAMVMMMMMMMMEVYVVPPHTHTHTHTHATD